MTKVFIHGNPETEAIWRPLLAALRSRGVDDIVTLSPPGFGAPISTDWDPHIDTYRQWVIHALEQLGTDIDVVAHDWGAGHLFGVLRHRPDLVRSWISDCAGLLHPDYVWHDAALGWQTPEVGEQIVAAMVAMSDDDFITSFTALGMTKDIATDVKKAITPAMGACVLGLYRSAAQPVMATLGQELSQATLPPGLVVIADNDHYAGTVPMMHDMATALHADTMQMTNCGHWWMIENPEHAADAFCRFWEQCD